MDAAQVIAAAAERAGADMYAPGEWDGDDASSVALVLHSDRRVVLTINADDLIYVLEEGNVWGDLYVWGYRADRDVMSAADVLHAVVREEDGASLDPQGDGIVSLNATQTPDIAASIAAAMFAAAQSTHRYQVAAALRHDVAALLPDGLAAQIIPARGEEFVAVNIVDTADVAQIVVYAGRVSVEGVEDDSPEFGTVAEAVAYVVASRTGGTGGTVATLAIAGALGAWLATGYGPAILGF